MLRSVAIGFGLVCLVVAVYGQTANFEFVSHDDGQHVYENGAVATGLSAENLVWAFGMVGPSQWHPLTWISHQLDCELYGLSARGHHLTNVALHAASVVLLFLLLRNLTGHTWPCALAAGLFAVHPVNVESVAWVAERKNVLSMLLGLLTLCAYAAYARRGGRARYVFVAVLLAAAMMAKPMFVTLPALLLLLDFWPLNRTSIPGWPGLRLGVPRFMRLAKPGHEDLAPATRMQEQATDNGQRTTEKSLRFALLEKIPLQVLAGGLALMTVLRHRMTAAAFLAENPTVQVPQPVPVLGRLADSFVSYVTYLRMLVWPADLAVVLPDRPDDYYETIFWPAAGAILLLAAITAVAVARWRRRPYVAFGWFWFLIAFVPVVGILPVGAQALADRYAYLPLIGPLVALACLAGETARTGRWRRLAVMGTCGLVLLGLGIVAHAQTGHWRNSVTLFARAIAVTGGERMAHYNLGLALHQRGRREEAIEQYRAALRMNDRDAKSHHNLALVLTELGRSDEALTHYNETIRLEPGLALAHSNLGGLLATLGRAADAESHILEAIRLNPQDLTARVHLGAFYQQQGRLDEAKQHLEAALEIQPNDPKAHTNLGIVYHDQRRFEQAIHHFERALEADPRHVSAWSNLSVTLHATGRFTEALRVLEEAVELDPRDPKLHVRLGTLYGQMQQLEPSIVHLRRAAELLPDDAAVQFNLAMALARDGQFAAAQAPARRSIGLRPDGAAAYNLLGSILASQGNTAAAADYFRAALALRPDWLEAARNLARVAAHEVMNGPPLPSAPQPEERR